MDLCSLPDIKALLARHGFRFSKSMGQNFLIAPWVPQEIAAILHTQEATAEKPRPKISFEVGETVRLKEGAFQDFNGRIEEVDYDRNRLRVTVEIFGRETPVDISFSGVEKI